jgi:hypothetical protein
MPFKGRTPNPPLFLHVQADCPCCGKEIALLYRSVGHLAAVEVKHWNQEKVSP